MQLLRAAAHKRMPWKNGGGETVEITVFPENSALGDFDWRVSMATVATDGPFSIFDGIDRTLSVLSGDGMSLSIEGLGENLLTPQTPPLRFPADAPTMARLTGGPIIDLNVMTRRRAFSHTLTHHVVVGLTALPASSDKRLLLALDNFRVSTEAGLVSLQFLDCLVLDGSEKAELMPKEETLSFYLIEIVANPDRL